MVVQRRDELIEIGALRANFSAVTDFRKMIREFDDIEPEAEEPRTLVAVVGDGTVRKREIVEEWRARLRTVLRAVSHQTRSRSVVRALQFELLNAVGSANARRRAHERAGPRRVRERRRRPGKCVVGLTAIRRPVLIVHRLTLEGGECELVALSDLAVRVRTDGPCRTAG